MQRKTRTILIIDDEPKTCINLSKILTAKRGYHIITASNGKDAIKILTNGHSDIDVIVTDMYMPESTGLDVITFARTQNPEMKIILISGGDRSLAEGGVQEDKFIHMARKYGKAKFLKKPFETDDLITLIESFPSPEN